MSSSPLLKPTRKAVYPLSVFLLFCFYMFWPVNFYLAQSVKDTYYMMLVPVLVGAVLYFRRLRDGVEYKLLLAYWLWFWLTRVLNGSFALQDDYDLVFDLALMLPLFALGLALDAAGRRRFLDWFSAAVGGYHFLLGLICLAAFVQRRLFINPITEGSLGMLGSEGFQRINILDTNPDSTAYWFLMPFFLMVYQFFACRNRLWRVPIALSALVDFLVIAITYTRSVKLAVAVSLGLLVMLPVRRILKTPKAALRIPVLLLSFLVSLLVFYQLSDLSADGLSRLSYALYPPRTAAESSAEAVPAAACAPAVYAAPLAAEKVGTEEPGVALVSDPRSWAGGLDEISSLRITVWRSAFLALRVKPSVLLVGQLSKDAMTISNTFTPHNPPHYHNALIQVLMLTGLPGLLLILALLALTVVKAARLFFSSDPRATLAVKTLVLPVAAVLIYSMLEAMLFTYSDVRPLYYYIMSGMLLGFYYDIYPRKHS